MPSARAEVVSDERLRVLGCSAKGGVLVGVKALDAAVAEIRGLDHDTQDAVFVLSEKVAALAESQLWKLRLDPAGKVRYKTFEDFATPELGMSKSYAQTLNKIMVRYTYEDFVEVGSSKLRLVLQAPADQQAELLQKIKETGAGKRAVADEVKKLRKKAETAKGARPAGKPKKERPAGSITVASIIGKGTHHLFKKPEGKDEKPAAAKSFDGAYAYFDLGNDTRCWLYLKKKDNGSLVVQHDIRRIED